MEEHIIKIQKMARGYNIAGVDGARDFLRVISKLGIDIDLAAETLSEYSKKIYKEKALEAFGELREEKDAGDNLSPLERRRKHKRMGQPLQQRNMVPIMQCSCGGIIEGVPMPQCETGKTGRKFYRQCNTCDFYSELFFKDGNFTEVEGGENGSE